MSVSVTVETIVGPRNHPNGLTWNNDAGWLAVHDEDRRIIAEYAAGSWHAVRLIEDDSGGKS